MKVDLRAVPKVLKKVPLATGDLIVWVLLGATVGFGVAWVIQAERFVAACFPVV